MYEQRLRNPSVPRDVSRVPLEVVITRLIIVARYSSVVPTDPSHMSSWLSSNTCDRVGTMSQSNSYSPLHIILPMAYPVLPSPQRKKSGTYLVREYPSQENYVASFSARCSEGLIFPSVISGRGEKA